MAVFILVLVQVRGFPDVVGEYIGFGHRQPGQIVRAESGIIKRPGPVMGHLDPHIAQEKQRINDLFFTFPGDFLQDLGNGRVVVSCGQQGLKLTV